MSGIIVRDLEIIVHELNQTPSSLWIPTEPTVDSLLVDNDHTQVLDTLNGTNAIK